MAVMWMSKAVERKNRLAYGEIFDTLWMIGTQESYEQAIDVKMPQVEIGDGVAMGRRWTGIP